MFNDILALLLYTFFAGWQWDPKDRPTFKEIHNNLEHMFDKSSISDGK